MHKHSVLAGESFSTELLLAHRKQFPFNRKHLCFWVEWESIVGREMLNHAQIPPQIVCVLRMFGLWILRGIHYNPLVRCTFRWANRNWCTWFDAISSDILIIYGRHKSNVLPVIRIFRNRPKFDYPKPQNSHTDTEDAIEQLFPPHNFHSERYVFAWLTHRTFHWFRLINKHLRVGKQSSINYIIVSINYLCCAVFMAVNRTCWSEKWTFLAVSCIDLGRDTFTWRVQNSIRLLHPGNGLLILE